MATVRAMTWSTADIPDQHGRTAVVTGGNGGLGLATVTALAAKGAHVVVAARDQAKAAAAREQVRAAHPDASLEVVELDLGSLASVERAAATVLERHERLDLLVDNAGVMAMPEGTTEDGFETQLGVNVLGHWVLTARLLPALVHVAGSRVVTLSSVAQHQGRALDPADPHLRRSYDPWRAYGNTKLAMRHLAVGLQRELSRRGARTEALAAHPGFTDSELQQRTVESGGGGFLGRASHVAVRRIGMSVEQGALSQLRAATDPDARGGQLYGPLLAVTGPPVRRPLVRPGTDEAVRRLWQVCEAETGVAMDVATAVAGR